MMTSFKTTFDEVPRIKINKVCNNDNEEEEGKEHAGRRPGGDKQEQKSDQSCMND